MTESRIIEHPYFTPGGPVTTEYLLPVTAADCENFPAWFHQFIGCSSADVTTTLKQSWRQLPRSVQPIVSFLTSQRPRSIAKLTDYNEFWVVLESNRGFHCLAAPTENEMCAFDADFNQLMHVFGGLRDGYDLPPDSGFAKDRLLVVRQTDPNQGWRETGPWESSVVFFSTGSGNLFLFRRDGVIGKWTHDSGVSRSPFREEFSNLNEFVEGYVTYLSNDDKESPFYS